MSTSLGIRPAALPALRALLAAIGESGPTPCMANPDAWTGDVEPDMTEAAVELCVGWCPVLTQCGNFATANRETAGIWAGKDRTPRSGRPAAEQKARTA